MNCRAMRGLNGAALDHNFCLSRQRQPLRPVAWLQSRLSGIRMQLATTEPGLQVYTAGHLPQDGAICHAGQRLRRHAGVALEAQAWPDAPNRPGFPDSILRAGETYRHVTCYRFNRP